ncbi:MAG: NADH-quinone oxidoreductase subunit NuoH [Gammaproteobacteria bacterium]|jgi:NADH-quinone oxidoreductase subunit H|nr:NADH-quinone oxidoreductase subunit NuoH [Gammaproteobacteria bacterium]MBT6073543.1 NADH-quinone oxidoreductase subunit NuoH [Gammaproteobacteria bacterium]
MKELITSLFSTLTIQEVSLIISVINIIIVTASLILFVVFMVYFERKIMGYMHARIGPNRVGPKGIFQSLADTIKLLFKEIIIPAKADRFMFLLAPILLLIPAIAAWAVVPLNPEFLIADINAGLLYLLALTSFGVYGVILAGWASNSKYAFLGSMRAAAQMVAYEIAMGFALVGVLMAGGSLKLGAIVAAQSGGIQNWFFIPLFPLFIVYFISGVAETNRHPFDVAEGEAEIVAGFHVEYSGAAFAIFFLAEYINMALISILTAIFFLGGWESAFSNFSILENSVFSFLIQPSIFWLLIKTLFFLFVFVWLRATFPRYRYDQLMTLGWKVLIPITIVWIGVECIMFVMEVGPWSSV